jgi:disulfide bond formation protein DsbB
MYPLVVIFGTALVRRERRPPTGTAVLAGIGAVIAAYHVALEWFPSLDSGACSASVPCTLVWFRVFGVFSLPTLALTAFLLILTLLLVRDPDEPDRWSDR